jgi:hypothetical protein
VDSKVSHKEGATSDGPIPVSTQALRTEPPSDIRQARSTVGDVAVFRRKVVGFDKPPCRAMDRGQRSGWTAGLMSPVAEAKAPWCRAIPADSHVERLHEDTSFDVLKVLDVHALRSGTCWVGYMMPAEAPLGTELCSGALGSHPGSCVGFLGWDAAECLRSSYASAAVGACHLRPRPWAAWHFACDAMHFHHRARADSSRSGTAREARPVPGCDPGCGLVVEAQLGTQGLGTALVHTRTAGIGNRETPDTAPGAVRGCRCAESEPRVPSGHGPVRQGRSVTVVAQTGSCPAT